MKRIEVMAGLRPRVSMLTLALALACAGFLWSCTTTPPVAQGEGQFKFSVLRYREPVEVKGWAVDPAQSANPEGAALNITTAMQHGDLNQWLASWDNSERPNPSPAERDGLLQKWQSLKDGQVMVLGRVVAGADLVIEVTVKGQSEQTLKLPLKRENGQWYLTAMDSTSEFLNWESSPNKIVAQVDTLNFKQYLKHIHDAHN